MTSLVMSSSNNRSLSSVGDYIQLLKPRIMCLVVFTYLSGMCIAPGTIHPIIAIMATLCVAIGSGASSALNMWYDSDIDAIMERTKKRPVPSGKIRKEQALECGIVLSTLSVFLMAMTINYTSALLLAISIFSYVVVYTMILKRRTPQNIVIGGIAGAFPPVIGWASVTGSISVESLLLLSIIFMWTPPHFWAISLINREEYRKAGVPMMPVYCVHKTKIHILVYSVLLLIFAALPGLFTKDTLLYEVLTLSLGMVFLSHAIRVYKKGDNQSCMGLFTYSIYYLFMVFASVMICF